jgi:dTDP-4-amino-4,6-dideoxygalactose transaminase
VHYAGVACDMDAIMDLARQHNLFVIEDAAQAIDSFYRGRPLGGIGHLAAFSFHETKNIMAGEGGMLVINDEQFVRRAEIIREKGTNRSAFFRGEVDKYGWVDVGSSFLPSDIIAAFLYAQLENLADIQARRRQIWGWYREGLAPLAAAGRLQLPHVPDFATNNAHMFYVVCRHGGEREGLINHLKGKASRQCSTTCRCTPAPTTTTNTTAGRCPTRTTTATAWCACQCTTNSPGWRWKR